MSWRGYKDCCYRSALDQEAGFCEECGTPLMRCIAHSECGGLVGPEGPCPNCVAPELLLDRGAVTRAGVGHSLALPLVLRNAAVLPRTLWVEGIHARRGEEPFRPVPLPWQRIDHGGERAFGVETGALDRGGTAAVDIAIAMGTRHRGYAETYLFGTAVSVGAADREATTITQNFDLSGSTGGLVNIRENAAAVLSPDGASTEREPLALTRYERFEREFGLRGYADGRHVPRLVEFRLHGFPERHAPRRARIGARGALVMGRYPRRWHATDNPDPSDVVLRVTDPATGRTDPEASRTVSRRHLDVMVLNERLYLHVRGANGVAVNGEPVAAASLHALEDGDVVHPVPRDPAALALTFRFLALPDGTVEAVRIDRQPAAA